MKFAHNILLGSFLLGICFGSLQAKAWHGVVPLHSNKTDVERLLGKPLAQDRDGIHYDFENEYVVFALARQDGAEDCARNLPLDTVIRIAVIPKRKVQITDLHFRENSFGPFEPLEPQGPEFKVYMDEQTGLIVRTYKGNVDRTVYVAEKKDQHLCSSYYRDATLVASRIICMLCPTIMVDSPEKARAGATLTFAVNVTVGTLSTPLTYKWSLNAGTIMEGQGTNFIRVGTKSLEGKTIKATVEVGGIDSACSNKASSETEIIPPIRN